MTAGDKKRMQRIVDELADQWASKELNAIAVKQIAMMSLDDDKAVLRLVVWAELAPSQRKRSLRAICRDFALRVPSCLDMAREQLALFEGPR